MVQVHSDPPLEQSSEVLEYTEMASGESQRWYEPKRQRIVCIVMTWGYSSAGRAPALHAGGQRFDPAYLHQSSLLSSWYKKKEVVIAQNRM